MKKNPVTSWAWFCDFGLCKWAEPTRERLVAGGKPSPEARPVLVTMTVRVAKARGGKGKR